MGERPIPSAPSLDESDELDRRSIIVHWFISNFDLDDFEVEDFFDPDRRSWTPRNIIRQSFPSANDLEVNAALSALNRRFLGTAGVWYSPADRDAFEEYGYRDDGPMLAPSPPKPAPASVGKPISLIYVLVLFGILCATAAWAFLD